MGELWGFLVLAVVLSLTPGPDDVLVVRSSVRGGPRLGAATTLGIAVGTSVWGAAAALGLAAAVALGSAPLIAQALGRRRAEVMAPTTDDGGTHSVGRAFLVGLTGDVLNPKIGLFYLAVVPQFVPAAAPALQYSLLLCAVDVAVATSWLLLLSWSASAAVTWLRRPAVDRWSQALFSGALVALGATAALGV